jgi:hypothetical protein
MKRILVGGLLLFALAGSVLAQQAMQLMPQGTPLESNPIAQPATHTGHRGGTVQGACCTQQGCQATKTICVPEQTKRIIETPVYSKVCEPLCVPSCCSLGSLFHHCSGDCGHGVTCEHPRNRYFLYKRICVEECPAVKCAAVCVPACAPGCGPQGEVVPMKSVPK